MTPADQILTAAQTRAAEQALIDAGTSVGVLMDRAGKGAAGWVHRLAAGGRVTVLCGPGNNGGDGYVLAEALRARGGRVALIAAAEPRSDAAREVRAAWQGEVLAADADVAGEVFVDCLYGSGLSRPLEAADVGLLSRLAAAHGHSVAVDLPSGIATDTGAALNEGLPGYDLTLALGAWKPAHALMPAAARMGARRLVPIGLGDGGSRLAMLAAPHVRAPAADAHKYARGLVAVIGGAMPGAALLACRAAQGAGAGYVRLLSPREPAGLPPDIVHDARPLVEALADRRIAAALVGPGLGRDEAARGRLEAALALDAPLVVDADALVLLTPEMLSGRRRATLATPHEGELARLERSFGLAGAGIKEGSKIDRARALAARAGLHVVAKGPDNVVAAPLGRGLCSAGASSWLSVAGTGDVLAGTIAGRLAVTRDPMRAAGEGLWLHAEAARLAGPAFGALALAGHVRAALAAAT